MPLQKSFSIIGFLDYGGAWGGYGSLKNFEQSDEFKMHMGYGIGLAFRTPIGPIRIDFALNEEGSTRTHFTFGTSF
jgi:outer membrane protein insertion porin family